MRPTQTINKLLEIKFGSHLYGTNTPSSDVDYKGIYLPTAREICLNTYSRTIVQQKSKKQGERNTSDDVDREYFSLDRYLQLLLDGQTVALDMFFAPDWAFVYQNPQWCWVLQIIFDHKMDFLSSNINAFVGYARRQAARYGIRGSRMHVLKALLELLDELPPHDKLIYHLDNINALEERLNGFISLDKKFCLIEVNRKKELFLHANDRSIPLHATVLTAQKLFRKLYDQYSDRATKAMLAGGRDYKAISHALRVNAEAKELLTTGHITFPRPEAELLKQVKMIGTAQQSSDISFDVISQMIEDGLKELVVVQERSILNPTPNRELADNLVFKVYQEIVRCAI